MRGRVRIRLYEEKSRTRAICLEEELDCIKSSRIGCKIIYNSASVGLLDHKCGQDSIVDGRYPGYSVRV